MPHRLHLQHLLLTQFIKWVEQGFLRLRVKHRLIINHLIRPILIRLLGILQLLRFIKSNFMQLLRRIDSIHTMYRWFLRHFKLIHLDYLTNSKQIIDLLRHFMLRSWIPHLWLQHKHIQLLQKVIQLLMQFQRIFHHFIKLIQQRLRVIQRLSQQQSSFLLLLID